MTISLGTSVAATVVNLTGNPWVPTTADVALNATAGLNQGVFLSITNRDKGTAGATRRPTGVVLTPIGGGTAVTMTEVSVEATAGSQQCRTTAWVATEADGLVAGTTYRPSVTWSSVTNANPDDNSLLISVPLQGVRQASPVRGSVGSASAAFGGDTGTLTLTGLSVGDFVMLCYGAGDMNRTVVASNNTGVAAITGGTAIRNATVSGSSQSQSLIGYQATGTSVVGKANYTGGSTWPAALLVGLIPADASVVVAPTSAALLVGATQQLTASLIGLSGGVTWSSGTPSVATVSSTGLVTAVGAGTATITATSTADGSKAATSAITVTLPPTLSVDTSNPAWAVPYGGSNPTAITRAITNTGGGSLGAVTPSIAWGTGEPAGWLTVGVPGGNASCVLTPTLGTLPPRLYHATVTLTPQNGAPVSFAVTMQVEPTTATDAHGHATAYNAKGVALPRAAVRYAVDRPDLVDCDPITNQRTVRPDAVITAPMVVTNTARAGRRSQSVTFTVWPNGYFG